MPGVSGQGRTLLSLFDMILLVGRVLDRGIVDLCKMSPSTDSYQFVLRRDERREKLNSLQF